MNQPPSDPSSPPEGRPFGKTFWIWFFAPIAIFLVGTLLVAISGNTDDRLGTAIVLTLIAGGVAILSSMVCAIMVGTRSGGLAGFLAFCGFVMIYWATAFVGCSLLLGGGPPST